jgi:hypothetical protein
VKGLLLLLAFFALAFLPSQAGVSVSVHIGGGYGGFHGGYGGHGYSGGYRGCYSGCYYGGYPSYGYGVVYAPPAFYYGDDSGYYPPADASEPPPAPQTEPTAPSPETAPAPPTGSSTTTTTISGPIPAGTYDEFGYVHSPYTTSTFKVPNVTDGQIFHDPITGQIFQVHVNPAPKSTTPTGPIPSASTPTGKIDQFGYVHSPYSTFTFKVQDGNYAQTFHDPITGQPFTVTANGAPKKVASAQPVD